MRIRYDRSKILISYLSKPAQKITRVQGNQAGISCLVDTLSLAPTNHEGHGGTYITSDNFPVQKISFQNSVGNYKSRREEMVEGAGSNPRPKASQYRLLHA